MTKTDRTRYVFQALRDTAARTQPAVRAQLEALGLRYRAFYIANAILVEAGGQQHLAQLALQPEVGRLDPDVTVKLEPGEAQPAVPEIVKKTPWNIRWIKAPEVWALGYKGQDTVVGVNDSGANWTHPHFCG